MNRPDVLALFARQHWVAGWRQLADLGVGRSELSRARQQGLVTSPIRGVVAVAGVELSFAARALCAQLAAGGSTFVSGPTAGALHGLRDMPRGRIEVTIEESRRVILPPGHRIVRTSWIEEARDVVARADGLRVASPLRTLFGLASQFNQHRFERAAEDLWHKGLVTPDQADEYLAAIRRSGRTGVSRMETWLERLTFRPTAPAQSGLEQDFLAMIAQVGLPTPVRQHPLLLATGELIHLDLAWIDVRLAVEPGHSWWHGGDVRQRRDQARDRACAVVGWHVARYDETARRTGWGPPASCSPSTGAAEPISAVLRRLRPAEREQKASRTVRRRRS
jgi:hypothetical protein